MIDKSNMYKILEDFPNQIREGYRLGEGIDIQEEITSIAVAGMGGSALPDEILKCYLDIDLPIHIIRNYKLRKHVNKKTLFIAISYSGNTEETLNCFREASRIGCPMLVIASGGKLQELADTRGVDFIKIPKGIPPRNAYGYQFFAMLRVLENSQIIPKQKALVDKTIQTLQNNLDTIKTNAKKIVEKLDKKIPIIYTAERNWAIAYKWKTNFNENTKIHSFWNIFPELNHNEMMGYSHLFADYAVIIIRDDEDYHRIKKRMDVTKKLIKQHDTNVVEVRLAGSNRLVKLFSAIVIGDWVSYFLALQYDTDPSPTELIEHFKKELG